MDYLEVFIRELRNRNYARNTIKAYSKMLKAFLAYADESSEAPGERIPAFLDQFSVSPERKRIAQNSIKVFYKFVLQKPCPYDLTSVKIRKRIPTVLARNEILEILGEIKNKKHYLIIALLYSAGLRLSEVITLQVKDVNLDQLSIHIRNGKHHKDRVTVFSEKLKNPLGLLLMNRSSGDFLFLTQQKKKYAPRTIQYIFSSALAKTTLTKKASCHTLRHSFATHLLEDGIDIKSIKILMGHKDVKTTMQYVHLADPLSKKIKSPF